MRILDRSSGGFLIAACLFVYGTVLVETWMLTTESAVAMVATLTLIIVLAGVLCRAVLQLMGPEDHPDAPRERQPAPTTAAPVSVPAPARRPATRGRVTHTRPA